MTAQDSVDRPAPTPMPQPRAYKDKLFDAWKLTYANSFPSFWTRLFIRTVEAITARPQIILRMRRWEKKPDKHPEFWRSCLDEMGIEITTPEEQRESIPAEGPLVVVCNHPHGMVDGVVLARLMISRRTDFKILTRALLAGVEAADANILPVAFPHEENAVRDNIEMRKEAIKYLQDDGCIALFPAGTVSTSKTWFGPVVEPEWMPFLSKMVRQSNARVLPIFFPGSNSRIFQIANRISPLCRQSLLMYEIRKAFDHAQSPVVGKVLEREDLDPYAKDAAGLMKFLRKTTLDLNPLK